jgi:hypothetical protein
MAHFARIVDGVVQEVLVVNNVELNDDGIESEIKGIVFLQSLFGNDTVWVQTSYTGSPVGGPPKADRGTYAGPGDLWDGSHFITPTQP